MKVIAYGANAHIIICHTQGAQIILVCGIAYLCVGDKGHYTVYALLVGVYNHNLMTHLAEFLTGALIISSVENIPLLTCMFETASAVGTVGLTLGITPGLGIISKLILTALMFLGRVGGLTLIYATVKNTNNYAKLPLEKLTVG